MAIAGSLGVLVTANTGRFDKGMDKAGKKGKKFSNVAGKARKGISKLFAPLSAGASFAGIVASLGAAVNSMDELAKSSRKLGIAPEALKALQFGAEASGVAVSTLNMALQRFTRRLSEAANGTGEAKAALIELNVDAEELVKLPLDVALGHIADSMADLSRESDQVRLAMKLFDSEGVALVNMLRDGSAGIKAFHAEAEKMGILFSAEDLKRAEDFAKAWQMVMEILKAGFTRTIVIIGKIKEEFSAFWLSFKDPRRSGEMLDTRMKRYAQSTSQAAESSRTFRRRMEGMNAAAAAAASGIEYVVPKIKELTEAELEANKVAEASAVKVSDIVDKLKEERFAIGKSTTELLDHKLAMLGADKATRRFAVSMQNTIETTKRLRMEEDQAEQNAIALRQQALSRVRSLAGGLRKNQRTAPSSVSLMQSRELVGSTGLGRDKVADHTRLTAERLKELIVKEDVSEKLMREMLAVLRDASILTDKIKGLN